MVVSVYLQKNRIFLEKMDLKNTMCAPNIEGSGPDCPRAFDYVSGLVGQMALGGHERRQGHRAVNLIYYPSSSSIF